MRRSTIAVRHVGCQLTVYVFAWLCWPSHQQDKYNINNMTIQLPRLDKARELCNKYAWVSERNIKLQSSSTSAPFISPVWPISFALRGNESKKTIGGDQRGKSCISNERSERKRERVLKSHQASSVATGKDQLSRSARLSSHLQLVLQRWLLFGTE